MLEWVMRVADRVDELVKADPEYQSFAKQRKELDTMLYLSIVMRFVFQF